jgi:opacity protein-like surface antigen
MRKCFFVIVALVWLGLPSQAAAQRVEVSGLFGWTMSDGVSGQPYLAPDGNIYDAVDIADSTSWGFSVGFFATEQVEVGFLFNQQMSTLDLQGTTTREVGDLKVNTYHPYVAFNMGEADSRVRPYFLAGIGATNYGRVSFTSVNGPGETGSETQFSTTFGAGVKAYPSPSVGVRFGVQWTPTYIKSDPGGWWCDPFWGCYLVGDAQYANQFTINGGVTVRF